ncbi:hypothetical protein Tco_0591834 [Tanacetum coccineum]
MKKLGRERDGRKVSSPPTGSNQGLKRKKTSKDVEPLKKAKSAQTFKGTTKSQPKPTSKSAQAEETVFEARDTQVPQNLGEDKGNIDEPPIVNADPKDCTLIDFNAFVMNRLQISDLTQDILVGSAYKLLKGTCRSYVELIYNMEECYKALNDQLDWNKPEGDRYPFNLRKPLPLIQSRNHQIIPVDYFFNNDLAYLQGGSNDKTYRTSLTKTKVAKYDLQGIEDMALHIRDPKDKPSMDIRGNKVSKHDVYSTKRILAVTKVKINKWYGYGHLEQIEVQRSDQQLYTFMEGDFPRFHLNDIEDMLLLVVQVRLFNRKVEDIMHLAAALRMFTRRIVIQKRVEDLQLGVESYQKKLNISRPLMHKADITDLEPYTTYSNPQGVIYLDKLERTRLMCSHELYKFSEVTGKKVDEELGKVCWWKGLRGRP